MIKRKPVECLGCGEMFVLARSNATRPICQSCRKDPAKRSKALWKHDLAKMKKRIDDEALRETRNLPRRDAFNPIVGASIVDAMMRDDW